MVVDDDDDDPLPERPKGTGKKEKSRAYTQEELDGLDSLLLWLKSEARSIQYSMETAGLTKYHNDRVPGLRGAPNTDDHSAYLSEVKKESWSYQLRGTYLLSSSLLKNWGAAQMWTKDSWPTKHSGRKVCPGFPKKIFRREESGN